MATALIGSIGAYESSLETFTACLESWNSSSLQMILVNVLLMLFKLWKGLQAERK